MVSQDNSEGLTGLFDGASRSADAAVVGRGAVYQGPSTEPRAWRTRRSSDEAPFTKVLRRRRS